MSDLQENNIQPETVSTKDQNELVEILVTTNEGVDFHIIHDELCRDTANDDSVDSNIVPDRVCECVAEYPNNDRVTSYKLSRAEAKKLKNDPRILSVDDPSEDRIEKNAVQDGDFNRNYSSNNGQQENWGLLCHTNKDNNIYQANESDPGGTYDYVLDGTGVDVVIIDSGIEPDHPEFQDANGVSRVKEVNWSTVSGVSFTQSANHYRDHDGHGTHVAGTVAGKTFGWAKNADIYAMKLAGLEGQNDSGTGISITNCFNALKDWHNKKNNPSDPAYTGRPTVVNMSFGFTTSVTQQNNTMYINGFAVTGGSYRGTGHSVSNMIDLWEQYGFQGRFFSRGLAVNSTYDTLVGQLADAGIHICIAAGNNAYKIDVFGGNDYDNNLTTAINTYPYHKGATPRLGTNGDKPGFMVGWLNNADYSTGIYAKSQSSCCGPQVNMYCSGQAIMSAMPRNSDAQTGSNSSAQNSGDYFGDSTYKQKKIQGTSMASPQMAGMVACLLQAHPDWSPAQAQKWFESNASTNIYTSGSSDDWEHQVSGADWSLNAGILRTLWGSTPRVAYFAMKGDKPFNIG